MSPIGDVSPRVLGDVTNSVHKLCHNSPLKSRDKNLSKVTNFSAGSPKKFTGGGDENQVSSNRVSSGNQQQPPSRRSSARVSVENASRRSSGGNIPSSGNQQQPTSGTNIPSSTEETHLVPSHLVGGSLLGNKKRVSGNEQTTGEDIQSKKEIPQSSLPQSSPQFGILLDKDGPSDGDVCMKSADKSSIDKSFNSCVGDSKLENKDSRLQVVDDSMVFQSAQKDTSELEDKDSKATKFNLASFSSKSVGFNPESLIGRISIPAAGGSAAGSASASASASQEVASASASQALASSSPLFNAISESTNIEGIALQNVPVEANQTTLSLQNAPVEASRTTIALPSFSTGVRRSLDGQSSMGGKSVGNQRVNQSVGARSVGNQSVGSSSVSGVKMKGLPIDTGNTPMIGTETTQKNHLESNQTPVSQKLSENPHQTPLPVGQFTMNVSHISLSDACATTKKEPTTIFNVALSKPATPINASTNGMKPSLQSTTNNYTSSIGKISGAKRTVNDVSDAELLAILKETSGEKRYKTSNDGHSSSIQQSSTSASQQSTTNLSSNAQSTIAVNSSSSSASSSSLLVPSNEGSQLHTRNLSGSSSRVPSSGKPRTLKRFCSNNSSMNNSINNSQMNNSQNLQNIPHNERSVSERKPSNEEECDHSGELRTMEARLEKGSINITSRRAANPSLNHNASNGGDHHASGIDQDTFENLSGIDTLDSSVQSGFSSIGEKFGPPPRSLIGLCHSQQSSQQSSGYAPGQNRIQPKVSHLVPPTIITKNSRVLERRMTPPRGGTPSQPSGLPQRGPSPSRNGLGQQGGSQQQQRGPSPSRQGGAGGPFQRGPSPSSANAGQRTGTIGQQKNRGPSPNRSAFRSVNSTFNSVNSENSSFNNSGYNTGLNSRNTSANSSFNSGANSGANSIQSRYKGYGPARASANGTVGSNLQRHPSPGLGRNNSPGTRTATGISTGVGSRRDPLTGGLVVGSSSVNGPKREPSPGAFRAGGGAVPKREILPRGGFGRGPSPSGQQRGGFGRGPSPSAFGGASDRFVNSTRRGPSPGTTRRPVQSRFLTRPSPEEIELKDCKEELEQELENLIQRRRDAVNKIGELKRIEENAIKRKQIAEEDTVRLEERYKQAKELWNQKLDQKKTAKLLLEEELRRVREKVDNGKNQHAILMKTKTLELEAIEREKKRKESAENELEQAEASERQKVAEIEEWKVAVNEAKSIYEKLQTSRSLLVLRTKERFNEYIEVKGNIRVFVRIRPLIPGEEKAVKMVSDDLTGSLKVESETFLNVSGLQETTNQWQFHFDRVFGTLSQQGEVFDEISQLVKSALDGYKVAIFAYGQTGGGKTYTMEGPPISTLNRKNFQLKAGVIPRAIKLIFEHISQTIGWKFSCSVSFVEIYNESVRDLLNKGKEVELQSVAGQDVTIKCSSHIIESEQEVFELLQKASKERSYATTALNDRSSRSHSVFQLKIEAKGPRGHSLKGLLSLVDLAGSEQIKKAKIDRLPERVKESQHINKSLSALGDVIQALSDGSKHVPYRNSKLTLLLKDSLGGESKTLMFTNISPANVHLHESINSLRFAGKVNNCKGNNQNIGKRK